VRDALLGLPVQDRDWVVVGAAETACPWAGLSGVFCTRTTVRATLARTERRLPRLGFAFMPLPTASGADLTRATAINSIFQQIKPGLAVQRLKSRRVDALIDLRCGATARCCAATSPAFRGRP
jgi:hypothetical protein